MPDFGDYAPYQVFDIGFNTIDSTRALVTITGTPTAALYAGNSTTPITAGLTVSKDFASKTGLHNVRVDGSTAGLVAGNNYKLILTAGSVGSVSLDGQLVAQFSVRNRSRNEAIYYGTVTGSASTTGFADSALPSRDDNHWRGRFIVFFTGALTGQARDITTYTNIGRIFVTSTWTQAPTIEDAYGIF